MPPIMKCHGNGGLACMLEVWSVECAHEKSMIEKLVNLSTVGPTNCQFWLPDIESAVGHTISRISSDVYTNSLKEMPARHLWPSGLAKPETVPHRTTPSRSAYLNHPSSLVRLVQNLTHHGFDTNHSRRPDFTGSTRVLAFFALNPCPMHPSTRPGNEGKAVVF